ncbi:MAG: signal peptidase I [Planctomycetales bacterium]|nr:signal peptidase I [Planctomycetales bacterium]MBN8624419.1 signal peptidase I [Planctomycetota bacterium]
MRKCVETVVCLTLVLVVGGAWLFTPFAVVSGSMSPTLVGPHRQFRCASCGERNVTPAEVPLLGGRKGVCRKCGVLGPILNTLPITPGDRMLVDYTALMYRDPRRWEVVAFQLPHEAEKIAVKRVVGLPGETIELRDGEVYVDGRHEPKPAAVASIRYEDFRRYASPRQWKLAEDEYFMLGDNPPISDDSRLWKAGPGVAAQLIVGKPFIVHFPLRTVHWYGRPVHVPDLANIRYIR